jgi:hypothetical protein
VSTVTFVERDGNDLVHAAAHGLVPHAARMIAGMASLVAKHRSARGISGP